jgi:hypothetical protein
MEGKEDRIMEEIGKLKEGIRQMAVKQDQLVKELDEMKGRLGKYQLSKQRR